jgi:hypothetical protein
MLAAEREMEKGNPIKSRQGFLKSTLRAELPGYDEYTVRVRYRLIPYVW